jgi:hypothetical protein
MSSPVLFAALAPYLSLALYDGYLHDRARHVPKTEQYAHAALGMSIALFLYGAFSQHVFMATTFLTIFLATYSIDEFVFHRGIARHERMIHAAAMSALAFFVVVWRLTSA